MVAEPTTLAPFLVEERSGGAAATDHQRSIDIFPPCNVHQRFSVKLGVVGDYLERSERTNAWPLRAVRDLFRVTRAR